MFTRIVLCSLAAFLAASPLHAQPARDWHVSFDVAAPMLSGRPDFRAARTRFEMPGGWTSAWGVALGRRFNARSLEAEFSQSGKLDDLYSVWIIRGVGSKSLLRFNETRQDRMLGAKLRWHTSGSRFNWEPFAGGGAVQHRCWERSVSEPSGEMGDPVSCDTGWSTYLSVGVGSAVVLKRLTIVPSIAASLLPLSGNAAERYTSEVMPRTHWSVTPSLEARVAF